MPNYRIKEVNVRFEIEIETTEFYGLFLNKTRKKWKETNKWGGALKDYSPVRQPESPTFSSLEYAEKQIVEWRKDAEKPIYHYEKTS